MDSSPHHNFFRAKSNLPSLAAAITAMLLMSSHPGRAQPAPEKAQGLRVTYESMDHGEDTLFKTTAPNVWLYVEDGTPPTPFLTAGPFKATWTGSIWVPIRSEYTFSVVNLQGRFQLKVNGEVALSTDQTDTRDNPIRLDKGTNKIVATFESPAEGDASVRLLWENRDIVKGPIPQDQLYRPDATASARQDRRRLQGRALFIKHRCANCHDGIDPTRAIPELYKPGPDLTNIGNRRRFAWMKQWIHDPQSVRNRATMPKLLKGKAAPEQAGAIAAYLTSRHSNNPKSTQEPPKGDPATGKKLFQSLHCAACHVAPESQKSPGSHEIALKHVGNKFTSGALVDFLKKPEAHYRWIRMPNFELSAQQAADLGEYLRSNAEAPKPSSDPGTFSSSTLARGKRLIQSLGCLDCHKLPIKNQATSPDLSKPASSSWDEECLSPSIKPSSKAPFFGFSSKERKALQAFGNRMESSLTRHVPVEFTRRAVDELNCKQCHGQFKGFPELAHLGGKLKPEWMGSFLTGDLPYKPRPWLDARMPKFPVRAEWLAPGLASRHGFPTSTPEPKPVDRGLAKIGRKLIASQGGLACVNCHAVGSMEPLQVFESEGVNLAYSGERLHKSYFMRWMLNPLQVDSQTRMPAFFSDGQSPLYNVLDGDARKQIEAIWHYLRLGDKMTPPSQ